MRKTSFAVCFCVLFAAALQAQNLVVNSSFNGSLNGWTTFNQDCSCTSPVTTTYSSTVDATGTPGSGSARVTNSDGTNGLWGFYQVLAVTPGTAYRVSAKVYVAPPVNTLVPPTGTPGAMIGVVENSANVGGVAFPSTTTNSSWVSLSYVVTPTTSRVTLFAWATNNVSGMPATAYFDDVAVAPVGSCDFAHSLSITPASVSPGDLFILSWCNPGALQGGDTTQFFRVQLSRSPSGPWTSLGDTTSTAVRFGAEASDVGTNYFMVEAHGSFLTVQSNVVSLNVAGQTAPVISFFFATPATIRPGQQATLSWSVSGATSVVIDQGLGAQSASGSVTVSPATTTTYTLTAMGTGGSASAQTTIRVASSAALAITAIPTGMTQIANAAGGVDHVSVTNVGGSTANVSVSRTGNFFNVSPTAFSLAAGASQTLTIVATPQPAGVYDGTVQFTDTANASDTVSASVRLLSASGGSTGGHAITTTPRVDVSAPAGTSASGSISFRNDGSGTLEGIAVSDKPWVVPESGLISIAPGQTRSVSFTISPSALPAGAFGSQTATLYLTYFSGAAAKRAAPDDSPSSTSNTQSNVNYTPSVALTSGPVPPLGQQVAYVIPGMLHASPTLTDFVATNRSGAALSAGSLLFIKGNVPPANAALSAALGSVPIGATFRYSDIIGQLFNILTPQVGTLQIRDADKFSVAASMATPTPSGTFLGSVKAFRTDRAATQNKSIYLVGVRNDAGAVTSLYIQETSGTDTTVRTDFLDGSGSKISSRTDSVSGSSLLTIPQPASPAGAVAAVITNTGGGSVVARAVIRYLSTNDLTEVIDWNAYNGGSPAASQLIPYVARSVRAAAAGQPGRSMTTDLQIMNTSATTALVGNLDYRAPVGCIPDSATLCLNGARFAVTAQWQTPDGNSGAGTAVPLTSDTGYFWFFGSSNVEVVVKILNACGLNANYWVFGAGLTNLNVQLTVRDTKTGAVKTYTNPANTAFQPIQDTGAFGTCAAGLAGVASLPSEAPVANRSIDVVKTPSNRATPAAACVQDAGTLCLNGGRFAVTARWRTNDGRNGSGTGVALTADTGYFWFFLSTNVEVVIKVLNACGLNSKFWVFAGGLTNVNVDLTVRDTVTGVVKTYTNPADTAFQPIQDTGAFATCGSGNSGFTLVSASMPVTPTLALPVVRPSYVPAANAVSVLVPPLQTVAYTDVLSKLGVSETASGTLVLTTATGTPAITALLSENIDGIGSFSTSLPVAAEAIAKGSTREFAGLEDSDPVKVAAKTPNTYSNRFSLVETSGKSAVVRVTLYYYSSSGLTAEAPPPPRDYSIGPNTITPLTDLVREFVGGHRDELKDLHDVRVDFFVKDGDGTVIPYVITTESATGDQIVRTGKF